MRVLAAVLVTWGLRAYKGDPGMIGLEPTWDEHLANLLAVFREVRRVLRKDGTCWLNYGDAYAATSRKGRAGCNGNGHEQVASTWWASVTKRSEGGKAE